MADSFLVAFAHFSIAISIPSIFSPHGQSSTCGRGGVVDGGFVVGVVVVVVVGIVDFVVVLCVVVRLVVVVGHPANSVVVLKAEISLFIITIYF